MRKRISICLLATIVSIALLFGHVFAEGPIRILVAERKCDHMSATSEPLLKSNSEPISQIYIPSLGKWLELTGERVENGGTKRYAMDVYPWGKTAGGLFAPLLIETTGALDVAVTGSLASLATELDLHSAFTWEKFLRAGIDAHFDGATRGNDGVTLEETLLASTFWTRNLTLGLERTGQFVCPDGIKGVVANSKNSFNMVVLNTALADLAFDRQKVWFGYENGGATSTGTVTFYHHRDGEAIKLEVLATGCFDIESPTYVDISAAIPANSTTTKHRYVVLLLRDWAEFYIDEKLVAIGLNTPKLTDPAIAYGPYAIFSRLPFPTRLPGYIEMSDPGYNPLSIPVSPYDFGLANTDSHPARVFRLYQNGVATLFAGSVIAADFLTSHPVPILGYASKTVLFQATEAGTLLVELFMQSGQWRTIATITTAAGTLADYPIAADGVLARVTFTPTTYPCTVSDAEIVLTP